jgi:hypothetical protein
MIKTVPAYNCEFHIAKGGLLTVFAQQSLTVSDLIKSYRMARLHAKWKKIKKPTKWRMVPTITDVV